MCGIAGSYSPDKKASFEQLKTMADKLVHRGPDGEGFWIHENEGVGFAHRRLSIIDLSERAKQPMHYQNRFTITFNGEIYNYIELKKELEQKGYSFSSQSDTEVLMALYADEGYECLKKLDGMFAFAIWDDVKKELFIARDRFGEKPLYYTFFENTFYFASEMKALFSLGISKLATPDRIFKYLDSNILIDEEDTESTFYKNIRQLDAAHYLILRKAKIEKRCKYWGLENVKINYDIKFHEAIIEFKRLLTDSIDKRMRTDTTIGSCLSGGIDSSAITLIAKSLSSGDRLENIFSARFKDFHKDEGEYIKMVTEKINGSNFYSVYPTAEQLMEDINLFAYTQEEPIYSASTYNQFCVMRLAKENNTIVLLEGQGADEQLGGYNHYYRHYLSYLVTQNPKSFLHERKGYKNIHGLNHPYHIPRKMPLWYLGKLMLGTKYKFDLDIRSLLIKDSTQTNLKSLLRYGDRNSMAFSREIRVPFLNHHLSEFIFSLPIDFIFNEGWTKYILRKSIEGIVPDDITWRKDKVGYEPPQGKWLEKLLPFYEGFKKKSNYLDFTGGKKVKEADLTNWKWLMLKLYME